MGLWGVKEGTIADLSRPVAAALWAETVWPALCGPRTGHSGQLLSWISHAWSSRCHATRRKAYTRGQFVAEVSDTSDFMSAERRSSQFTERGMRIPTLLA